MKLSKTGWNNVIIFTVMSMILLINLTNGRLFPNNDKSTANNERSILGEHAVILTLAINEQIFIERIGQTWRAKPVIISNQALEQMMLSWQQPAALEISAPTDIFNNTNNNAIIVTINIAGQELPTVLSLYPLEAQFLIYHHLDKKWLSLSAQLYQQLIPFHLTGSI
jgi:hypothetical protein